MVIVGNYEARQFVGRREVGRASLGWGRRAVLLSDKWERIGRCSKGQPSDVMKSLKEGEKNPARKVPNLCCSNLKQFY